MFQLRPYQKETVEELIATIKDENKKNVLVNASVGAGKSLIIAETLKFLQFNNLNALCLTMNSILIQQNVNTYINQGGNASIYCAALGKKDCSANIVFGSPISVARGVSNNEKIARKNISIIVVDEAHNCNIDDPKSCYMKIINHYKETNKDLIVIGLTGTPFRGKGIDIVGENMLFNKSLANIDTYWLVKNKYLVTPVWGYFDSALDYDFSKVKIGSTGRFVQSELNQVVERSSKTGIIIRQVQKICKNRKGAFIFATSIKHCHAIHKLLGTKQSAVIVGTTPEHVRRMLINQAKTGQLKYLINVNVLCTGVDIPNFDTVVMVRPTESKVLYTQCIGRGLRLSPGKTECLILDYAENIKRHGDLKDPLLRQAVINYQKTHYKYDLECPECGVFNKSTSHTCENCSFKFLFKNCPYCNTSNSVQARECQSCQKILVDPNMKLTEFPACKDKIKSYTTFCNYAYMPKSKEFVIYYDFKNHYLQKKYPRYSESFDLGNAAKRYDFIKNFWEKNNFPEFDFRDIKKMPEFLKKNKNNLPQINYIEGAITYDGFKIFYRSFELQNALDNVNRTGIVLGFETYSNILIFSVSYQILLNGRLIDFEKHYKKNTAKGLSEFKKDYPNCNIHASLERNKSKYDVPEKVTLDSKMENIIEHIPFENKNDSIITYPVVNDPAMVNQIFDILDIDYQSDDRFLLRCYRYDEPSKKHIYIPITSYFSNNMVRLYNYNRLKKVLVRKWDRYLLGVDSYILDDGTTISYYDSHRDINTSE